MLRACAVLAAVISLAGCGGDQRICTTPTTLEASIEKVMQATGPQAQIAAARMAEETCVHRWAYRLARSSDPADAVARAAFAGCDTAPAYGITRRVQLYAEAGQPVGHESYRLWQTRELVDLALFHVVQARAGHCRVPE